MRAMAAMRFGGPEVLELRDVPEPTVGEQDALIEVHAASVNPVDCKVRGDGLGRPREFPLILGYDVSGVVRALGPRVQGVRVGDEVYASPSLVRPGANAELVAVDARTLAHKPRNLDHVQAAALPLVALTAWESLHKRAQVHRGETVLVHAGAGGVGHIAVQIGKQAGCRVLATAGRDESIEMCRRLGADVVLNYRGENVAERVKELTDGRGCEVVFDTIGGDVFKTSLECVGVNGRVVTILGPPADAALTNLYRRNVTLHLEFMGVPTVYGINPESQGQTLKTFADFVEADKIKPHVSEVLPLEDLAEGHRRVETRHVMGKIVVRVR